MRELISQFLQVEYLSLEDILEVYWFHRAAVMNSTHSGPQATQSLPRRREGSEGGRLALLFLLLFIIVFEKQEQQQKQPRPFRWSSRAWAGRFARALQRLQWRNAAYSTRGKRHERNLLTPILHVLSYLWENVKRPFHEKPFIHLKIYLQLIDCIDFGTINFHYMLCDVVLLLL